jgi:hypothetical protein
MAAVQCVGCVVASNILLRMYASTLQCYPLCYALWEHGESTANTLLPYYPYCVLCMRSVDGGVCTTPSPLLP